jgi:hypothetical protein
MQPLNHREKLKFNESGVAVVMVSFLSYRGSRPGHFYGVTDG